MQVRIVMDASARCCRPAHHAELRVRVLALMTLHRRRQPDQLLILFAGHYHLDDMFLLQEGKALRAAPGRT